MWKDKYKTYSGRIFYDSMNECWCDQENNVWMLGYTPEDGAPEVECGFSGLQEFYDWYLSKDDSNEYPDRIMWNAEKKTWIDTLYNDTIFFSPSCKALTFPCMKAFFDYYFNILLD